MKKIVMKNKNGCMESGYKIVIVITLIFAAGFFKVFRGSIGKK